MGNEKTIARVTFDGDQAVAICEGIKSALKLANLPDDIIMPLRLSTGETIRALEIVAEPVGDVATLYTMIARVG